MCAAVAQTGAGRGNDSRETAGRVTVSRRSPLTPESFQAATGVSRETLDRLQIYADLLRRWQRAINLVGAATLPDLWRRHMLDSGQLLTHLPPTTQSVVDIGSGAGFPGLVLAIMGAPGVHLVEADQRKAAFLGEVARATDTPVTIHGTRIEGLSNVGADVATARAVAPLAILLGYARPHLAPGGICLFLKGQSVDRELTDSGKIWDIHADRLPSLSDPSGTILRIGAIDSV